MNPTGMSSNIKLVASKPMIDLDAVERLLKFLGVAPLVAVFVILAIHGLGLMPDFMNGDAVRTGNAKIVMAALEKYHAAKGAYPVLTPPDRPISDLAPMLVGGGYLDKMPQNPNLGPGNRYVSYDGKAYGLWLFFEKTPPCLVEVGTSGSNWWGPPPLCKLN